MAAIAALLLGLAAIIAVGILLDLGVLASRRAGLETAGDSAARAAYMSCQGAPDTGCATEIASEYLSANLPEAQLEQVDLTAAGRVQLTVALTVDRPFAALFHAAPVRMEARVGFGGS